MVVLGTKDTRHALVLPSPLHTDTLAVYPISLPLPSPSSSHPTFPPPAPRFHPGQVTCHYQSHRWVILVAHQYSNSDSEVAQRQAGQLSHDTGKP